MFSGINYSSSKEGMADFMQTRLTGALAVNLTSMQKNSNTPFRFKTFTWRKTIRQTFREWTQSFLSYLTSYSTARRSYGKNYKDS